MITLTIDGRIIQAAPGATVMEAALAHGIDIPRLCYHPELAPSGGCRLCLIEVEGRPAPQPSCGMLCADGLVVHTQSERLTTLRREIIDLFVSDHPLRCVICDKNGHCDLQRYAYQYGIAESSFDVEYSRLLYQDDNPFFIRDHQYCILCSRCVRVCDEIVGANAIEIAGRGFTSHVATPFDGPLVDSTCVFCGNCVQVCPTAALMPAMRVGKGREWEMERVRTVCGYCGVGCALEYAVKDGSIVYAQGYPAAPVNGEFLCVKGRFGWDYANHPDRLTHPLVRRALLDELGIVAPEPTAAGAGAPGPKAGKRGLVLSDGADFVPVAWDTALDIVATKLAATVAADGPDAVAGLASARCTNEENYLFQKLMRATLGTNNVDHCARLCHASSVSGLGASFGSGAMTNPIRDIRDADCILITGSNTAESHPVIGYEVVRAARKGAHVVIIDPRRVPLVDHATLFLQPRPGTDSYVFFALAHVILREGWADRDFIAARTEGFDAFAESVKAYTPEVAALASGVPAELIERAARVYALGERARDTAPAADGVGPAELSSLRGRSTILYAMGITQRRNGTELVMTLANLALLCGQVGKPSTGVNPLRGQSNVQGACDMGALPNFLPGYQLVSDALKRKAVAQGWGLADLPAQPGLTVVELMHAALEKRVRAMFVMGENPMLSDPNLSHVEAALRALDFLVVQDIFLSETAQLADVVLPAASHLEKDGTVTNTERRVQLIHPVIAAPGEARPDWQILCALAVRLEEKLRPGAPLTLWDYPSTAAIMAEMARVTPIYGGVRHARLVGQGLTWPCPTIEHPGTPVLHTQGFSRGLGKFAAIAIQEPAEQPDAEYPLTLTTGRILYHYHTGTMTRRSEPLAWRESRPYAEISAADAAAAGIRDGGPLLITSRRGQVRAQARVSERVQPGTIFLSFHWKEAPANALTQDFSLDPIAKIPEFKVCAVRIASPKVAGHGQAPVAAKEAPHGRDH
ncbi:MAG: molybdopterin-dependent oxidoreductase [Anaerolineae bacterium]